MTTSTHATEAAADLSVPATFPTAVPDAVESTEGKLVYLALATSGECAVGDLVEPLGLPRITLYSVLNTLQSRGVVERVDDETFVATAS